MKNLLAFTAFLAAGFLLGSRRVRKAGPVNVIACAVEVDTSQATAALKEVQAQAVKTTSALNAVATQLQKEPLCRADFEGKRATGQTTRLVDGAIQSLFQKGHVTVRDHVDKYNCHRMAMELVLRRLAAEHPRAAYATNYAHCTIKLLNTHSKA